MIVSAFADEIAADLGVQLAVLKRHGIDYVDLRAVGGGNVIELDDAQALALRDELQKHGLAVATIASPIGKEPGDTAAATLRRRMIRAATVAHLLGTDLVRVFGFHPPEDGGDWREASLRSLRVLASCARETGVTLLLENEVGTAAASVEHATDLLASLAGDHVRAAFDPANALRCGDEPYPDGYARVKPWLRQVHVKDLDVHGRVVPAGFGTADWPGLLGALQRDGYAGLISLEPHLLRAGRHGGFTGPTLFGEAHRAFQALVTSNSTCAPTQGDAMNTTPTAATYSEPPEKRRGAPLTLRSIRYQPTVVDLEPMSYGANMAASRRARHEGGDEGLFVDPDGTVLEAPTASVFWGIDGVLKTPALDLGILPSITRMIIMEALDTLEVSAGLNELLAADEVFLASTSREIQPVSRIDDAEYDAPGPLCRAARRALDEAIARHGREAKAER